MYKRMVEFIGYLNRPATDAEVFLVVALGVFIFPVIMCHLHGIF